MTKLAIFDLDSTLNGIKAREHLVPANPRINQNWLPWHKAFATEKTNVALIDTMRSLARKGWEIAVVSNRCESLVDEIDSWFENLGIDKPPISFFLRQSDDHSHPTLWKINKLRTLLAYHKAEIVLVFDDDVKAIEAIRYMDNVIGIPVVFNE